jgi:hypothetical protein
VVDWKSQDIRCREVFAPSNFRIRGKQAAGHLERNEKVSTNTVTAAFLLQVVENAAQIGPRWWA